MNIIRFVRMAEALSRRGHEVHLVVKGTPGLPTNPAVREVRFDEVRWEEYHVVKTVLHSGFATLARWGGSDHPFIISNLGSVVGAEGAPGVYFYGAVREELWGTQQEIAARSRFVSILTTRSADLWRQMHGERGGLLEVPTGVDVDIPAPGRNPYSELGITRPVALYAGNLYSHHRQREVNLFWQERLNRLGRVLGQRGVQLVVMGPGETGQLDPACVIHAGSVDFRSFWNWQWHAQVGIVLAQGAVQDNESSKLYYYLRTGLPVACEAPVPNAWLVSHTGHGAVVDYDPEDVTNLAEAAARLARQPPKTNGVIPYMVANHSWDARAAVYAPALAAARSD
jgi:hypothetical protein